MTIEAIRGFLLWAGLINYGFLILWALLMLFARGLMHQVARWYRVSPENFDLVQFAGIVAYKVAIFFFYLIPYLVLRIIA